MMAAKPGQKKESAADSRASHRRGLASLSAERENMKKRKLEARSSQSSASQGYVEVDLLGGAAAPPTPARLNFQGMIDEANAHLDTGAIKKF
jgi:hypothetical protein